MRNSGLECYHLAVDIALGYDLGNMAQSSRDMGQSVLLTWVSLRILERTLGLDALDNHL